MSIAENLRARAADRDECYRISDEEMCRQAADAIESLTADNERLRALITIIAERHSRVGDLEYDDVIGAAVSGCQQSDSLKP